MFVFDDAFDGVVVVVVGRGVVGGANLSNVLYNEHIF